MMPPLKDLISVKDLFGAVTLRVALYACAILLAISIGLGIWLYVVTLQRDKAIADVAGWSAMAQLQNQAVEQWKDKADAQELKAAAAEKQAAQVRAESRQRVERIMAQPVPATCQEAVQWGALQGAILAEEWEERK